MATPAISPTPRTPVLSPSGTQLRFSIDIVFIVIATLGVVLRLYSRHLKRNKRGADDWLCVLGLFFLYCYFTNDMLQIFLGYGGHHISELVDDPVIITRFSKTLLSGQIIYPFPVTCARISLNVFYLRVFSVAIYKWIVYCNIALNVCWWIYSFVAPLTRCIPIALQWNTTLPGHCVSLIVIQAVIPLWGIVCDLITWTLPLPIVWKLHMTVTARIGLTCVFAVGLIVIAMDIVRVVTIFGAMTSDFTYNSTLPAVICFVESALSVFCACGPVMLPALSKFFGVVGMKRVLSFISNSLWRSQASEKSQNEVADDKHTDRDSSKDSSLDSCATPLTNRVSVACLQRLDESQELGLDMINVKQEVIIDDHEAEWR